MEVIGALILAAIGWAIVSWLFNAGTKTAGAAARAAVGKGSFSDNMDLAFKGMGSLEARISEQIVADNGDGPIVREIEVKGLFPVTSGRRLGFVTSVLDKTSGEYEPVISLIEAFQEPLSVIYQHSVEIGAVEPDQGFLHWSRVGVVLPQILQTPYGGHPSLYAVLRLVDLDNMPEINQGYQKPSDSGILWQMALAFECEIEGKGYEEAAQHLDEARALSLKIAMAVAMADGSLDDREGETIKQWVVRAIAPFSEEKQSHLKQVYNAAIKDSHAAAKTGDLALSELTEHLNEIGELSTKYETLELCFDVMAADGVADAEEMRTIRKIAEALELDIDEIDNMRDKKIIGLDTSIASQAGAEDLLGIESDWDMERIKKHLRAEFQKWNNRINTLSEGEERENAQRMLDLIADARKKYG